MFLCHPNHPWTKRERLGMTLVSLSITMVPSAFIGSTFAADDPGRKIFILLGVTIPDTVVGVLLYQLSIAETRWWCALCACFWSRLQSCLFCLALFSGAL